MKVPVSILIPIKNEAANLPRCLAAVAWADEIFVVDSQSTDGSQEIVEQFAKIKPSGLPMLNDLGAIQHLHLSDHFVEIAIAKLCH